MREKFKPINVLCIGMVLGLILFAFQLFATSGSWLTDTLYGVRGDESSVFTEFTDFFGHVSINSTSVNTYEYSTAVYPPLSEAFYKMIGIVVKASGEGDLYKMADSLIGSMIYVLYVIVQVLLFKYCLDSIVHTRCSEHMRILLALSLLCSYPFFAYAIKTGNPILLTTIVILMALHYMDSTSKVKKEMALILIAIAASFKIFPALLGLLYIKDKRYKEAIRLFIYGVIMFFMPFIFFDGLDGLKMFIMNLMQDQRELISLGTLPYILLRIPFTATNTTFSNFIIILFALILFFCLFLAKKKYVAYAIICEFMLLIPGVSQPYSLVYMVIPMLFWMIDEEEKTMIDYVYAILYVLIFWCWDFNIAYLALWAMTIVNLVTVIFQEFKLKGVEIRMIKQKVS